MRKPLPMSVFAAAAVLVLAGCATTHNPGWSGEGATPFYTAEAQCRTESSTVQPEAERPTRFTECMARHGWRRGAN